MLRPRAVADRVVQTMRFIRASFRTATILAFPDKPEPGSVLSKMCHLLGYRVTQDITKEADVIINWEDCTFRRSYTVLEALCKKQLVLNIQCKDISKRKVDNIHQAVFGYRLAVNPLEFHGQCVKKSNDNATHDGIVIPCPTAVVDEHSVYQRLVNNKKDRDYIEDIRVPVVGNIIPFCYLKHRRIADRFSNENTSAILCERDAVLSRSEVTLLLRLCRGMGLDYGELDVLRDLTDGRLYVVDVNNTPWGPPNHLDDKSVGIALKRLSEAFVTSFISLDHSALMFSRSELDNALTDYETSSNPTG